MVDFKYYGVAFSFFMSLFMSCLMSLIISVFNLGLVDDIVGVWLKAWAISFFSAFPVTLVVSPLVFKLVNFVVREELN